MSNTPREVEEAAKIVAAAGAEDGWHLIFTGNVKYMDAEGGMDMGLTYGRSDEGIDDEWCVDWYEVRDVVTGSLFWACLGPYATDDGQPRSYTLYTPSAFKEEIDY